MLRQTCNDLADTNDNGAELDTDHTAAGDSSAMKGSRSFDNAVLDKSKTGDWRLERPATYMSHVREMIYIQPLPCHARCSPQTMASPIPLLDSLDVTEVDFFLL